MIKIRKQIYIDPDDYAELQKEGHRNEASISEIIRTAIKSHLKRRKNKNWMNDPLTKMVGKLRSKHKNLSETIDKELYG